MTAIAEPYGETEVEADDEVVEPIGDMERAEYALSQVRYFRERRAEVEQAHQKMIDRADEWAADEDRKLADKEQRYLDELELFHRAVFTRDEKRKTINLPSGQLITRKPGAASVVIENEELFMKSAPKELIGWTNPQPKQVPDKKAIKAHIEATGEVVPGAKLTQPERKFEVKITGLETENGER